MDSMRRIALAAILSAGVCGCTFNKSLTLNKPIPLPAAASLRVRTLKVTAPAAGTNPFVLGDVTTPAPIVGTALKRADFVYPLSNDSAPMFRAALKDLLKQDPGSSVDAQLAADFQYGLIERKANANTVGLRMVANLVLTSNGQVVLEKQYTAFESDSYSTVWLTVPSSDFLDGLFQRALSDIGSQIASDSEVARHP
jgi:hypothetical protein